MKITRYPQSCLVVQAENGKVVIDPGINFLEHHEFSEIADVDAVLYTHQHADHYDEVVAKEFINRGVPIICNASTAVLVGSHAMVVEDGQHFEVAGMQVQARELPHMLLPDGSDGPQNTGYVIDNVFFHPGDGKEIRNLRVDTLALPITGPDMSLKESFDFAKQVEAKTIIPIHFDLLGADPYMYERFAKNNNMPFEMIVLDDGETVEL
jgi:L-ascorbate metabolism protein UlaG (beta-lactamase superfamily)